MGKGQRSQNESENQGAGLCNDHAAMPVIAVADISAHPRKTQHRQLAGKAEQTKQGGRTGQFIDQPLLRGVLHPRADQRNQLSDGKKLKVAVLECAEPCGQVENRVHLFILDDFTGEPSPQCRAQFAIAACDWLPAASLR
jgi:hypothetical protein